MMTQEVKKFRNDSRSRIPNDELNFNQWESFFYWTGGRVSIGNELWDIVKSDAKTLRKLWPQKTTIQAENFFASYKDIDVSDIERFQQIGNEAWKDTFDSLANKGELEKYVHDGSRKGKMTLSLTAELKNEQWLSHDERNIVPAVAAYIYYRSLRHRLVYKLKTHNFLKALEETLLEGIKRNKVKFDKPEWLIRLSAISILFAIVGIQLAGWFIEPVNVMGIGVYIVAILGLIFGILFLFISSQWLFSLKSGTNLPSLWLFSLVFFLMLLQTYMGFPISFVVQFGVAIFFSLLAIAFIYRARQKMKECSERRCSPRMVAFLETIVHERFTPESIIESGIKSDQLKRFWMLKGNWPNGVVFSGLFVVALLLFGSFLRPVLYEDVVKICNPNNSAHCLAVSVLVPSWIAERDETNIYVWLEEDKGQNNSDTRKKTSVWIETEFGMPFILEKEGEDQFEISQNLHVIKWGVETMPGDDRGLLSDNVEKFNFRVIIETGKGDEAVRETSSIIAIPHLRIPWGLRGSLEKQPFTTMMGIVYGAIFALAQLWIGQKVFQSKDIN